MKKEKQYVQSEEALDGVEQEIFRILRDAGTNLSPQELKDTIRETRPSEEDVLCDCRWECDEDGECSQCGRTRNAVQSLGEERFHMLSREVERIAQVDVEEVRKIAALSTVVMMPLLHEISGLHMQLLHMTQKRLSLGLWQATQEGQDLLWFAGCLVERSHEFMRARLQIESGDTSALKDYRVGRHIVEVCFDEMTGACAGLVESSPVLFGEFLQYLVELRTRTLLL